VRLVTGASTMESKDAKLALHNLLPGGKPMTIQQMHANSLQAYYQGILSELPDRQARIMLAIIKMTNLKLPITDRRIKVFLGLDDMNQVRPRVSELIAKGSIIEKGSVLCEKTGRRVRTVDLPNA